MDVDAITAIIRAAEATGSTIRIEIRVVAEQAARAEAKADTALAGLDKQSEEIKELKFQSLTYQHRMHRDIASISKDFFYKGGNLNTANTVEDRLDILAKYRPNEKQKVFWVENNDATFRKRDKYGKSKNINPKEVEHIKLELQRFVKFAQANPNECFLLLIKCYNC